MDRTREAIIPALQYMAETPMEKVYQVTFQCSVSVSSFSSLSSACQAALATIRAEWLRHGEEKCTVVEWLEITEGINSVSSLPPWRNVCISGRWPDPNNNLLKGAAYQGTMRSMRDCSNMVKFALFLPKPPSPQQRCPTYNLGSFSIYFISISLSLASDLYSFS